MQISFFTNLFESAQVEPHFINERCFGEDLAKWLIGEMRESGFSFAAPYQEDWGWEFAAEKGGERYFVQVGIADNSIGRENAEWIVAIESGRRWFEFGAKKAEGAIELCREIDRILDGEPQIAKSEWED